MGQSSGVVFLRSNLGNLGSGVHIDGWSPELKTLRQAELDTAMLYIAKALP